MVVSAQPHTRHNSKCRETERQVAMVGNYDVDAAVEAAVWGPGDDPEPDEQYICTLGECYFEPATGDVVLTFQDRATEKFFDVSVSVKAVSEWNEFVDGLPEVNES